MLLTCPTFEHNAAIPAKFTCDGGDINPELHIQNVPEGAKSLALIVDDPDATGGGTFVHWVVYNINPNTERIKQESIPPDASEGVNDFGRVGYGGPCPPTGSSAKPHRYFFKLYALDTDLDFEQAPTKADLEGVMQKHVLAQAELIGRYGR